MVDRHSGLWTPSARSICSFLITTVVVLHAASSLFASDGPVPSFQLDAITADTFEQLDATEPVTTRLTTSNLDSQEAVELLFNLGFAAEEIHNKLSNNQASFLINQTVARFRNDPDFLKGSLVFIMSNDPFIAFDVTVNNPTDEDLIFSARGFVPLIPITGPTVARNYLAVELIDADGDGQARFEEHFALFRAIQEGDVEQDNTGALFKIGNQIGDDIVISGGQTQIIDSFGGVVETFPTDDPMTIVFDSGVITGPAGNTTDPLINLFSTTQFILSPGDSARVRGQVMIADNAGLLPNVDLVNAHLESLAIPEPSSILLVLSSNFACLRRLNRRRRR